MGMFDSLLVRAFDTEYTIQTKEFSNTLSNYYWLDSVSIEEGVPKGVSLIEESWPLDAVSHHSNQECQYLFVLLDDLLVDFFCSTNPLHIKNAKNALSSIWSNEQVQLSLYKHHSLIQKTKMQIYEKTLSRYNAIASHASMSENASDLLKDFHNSTQFDRLYKYQNPMLKFTKGNSNPEAISITKALEEVLQSEVEIEESAQEKKSHFSISNTSYFMRSSIFSEGHSNYSLQDCKQIQNLILQAQEQIGEKIISLMPEHKNHSMLCRPLILSTIKLEEQSAADIDFLSSTGSNLVASFAEKLGGERTAEVILGSNKFFNIPSWIEFLAQQIQASESTAQLTLKTIDSLLSLNHQNTDNSFDYLFLLCQRVMQKKSLSEEQKIKLGFLSAKLTIGIYEHKTDNAVVYRENIVKFLQSNNIALDTKQIQLLQQQSQELNVKDKKECVDLIADLENITLSKCVSKSANISDKISKRKI